MRVISTGRGPFSSGIGRASVARSGSTAGASSSPRQKGIQRDLPLYRPAHLGTRADAPAARGKLLQTSLSDLRHPLAVALIVPLALVHRRGWKRRRRSRRTLGIAQADALAIARADDRFAWIAVAWRTSPHGDEAEARAAARVELAVASGSCLWLLPNRWSSASPAGIRCRVTPDGGTSALRPLRTARSDVIRVASGPVRCSLLLETVEQRPPQLACSHPDLEAAPERASRTAVGRSRRYNPPPAHRWLTVRITRASRERLQWEGRSESLRDRTVTKPWSPTRPARLGWRRD